MTWDNVLKQADKDTPNTPTWLDQHQLFSKASKMMTRAYKLLRGCLCGENCLSCWDNQARVETDKYIYMY